MCGWLQAFRLALEQCGGQAATAIFLDDSTRNVAAARQMGMFTVQVIASGPSHPQQLHMMSLEDRTSEGRNPSQCIGPGSRMFTAGPLIPPACEDLGAGV